MHGLVEQDADNARRAAAAPGRPIAPPQHRHGVERYLRIGDYALIGDTCTAALVGADGSVDWLCLPNFSDPSVFAAILDAERGGRLFVGPTGRACVSRRYCDGSAVLETRFETAEGTLRITDFMSMAVDGIDGKFRPARRLVRIVEAESGAPEVSLVFAPRPDDGRTVPRLRPRGKSGWVAEGMSQFLLFQTDIPVSEAAQGRLAGVARLRPGERHTVSLSFCPHTVGIIPEIGVACERDRDGTLGWWRAWSARIDYRGPFRDALVRSLVVLRLLTFSQSGAVIAAPTSSLPEAIGGERNWDYRYCWLRDAAFILQSFLELGFHEEAAGFFRWLMHATQRTAPRLRTLYDIFGRTNRPERQIETLEGYRGSAPVHAGNEAQSQLQLDVYGAVLTSAALYVQHGGRLGHAEQRRLRGLGESVCQDWTLPDNGIWELRGGRKHHTYSKAMCWAALDALTELCACGAVSGPEDRFRAERDLIRETVLANAWNPERGAFVGAFGEDFLDASLLLLPRLGIIAADDPRMVATFERIDAELGHGCEVRRYAPGVDGLGSTEGTFVACGFWAAEYLVRRGELDAARARIEGLLARANDLTLMAEETDPETGELLGNFPQAFSHAGLINAALELDRAERRQREGSA